MQSVVHSQNLLRHAAWVRNSSRRDCLLHRDGVKCLFCASMSQKMSAQGKNRQSSMCAMAMQFQLSSHAFHQVSCCAGRHSLTTSPSPLPPYRQLTSPRPKSIMHCTPSLKMTWRGQMCVSRLWVCQAISVCAFAPSLWGCVEPRP